MVFLAGLMGRIINLHRIRVSYLMLLMQLESNGNHLVEEMLKGEVKPASKDKEQTDNRIFFLLLI